MSQRAPPAMATWLIERLGPLRHRESLTGDLIEQYHRGASASWYWRQVAMAVLLARLHFVRSVLAIPKARVILRLIIECAMLALGAGTLSFAAAADKVSCAVGICVDTKIPVSTKIQIP